MKMWVKGFTCAEGGRGEKEEFACNGTKLIEDEDVSERVYLCGGGGGAREEFACNGTKLIEDEDVSERVYLCGGGGGGGERGICV